MKNIDNQKRIKKESIINSLMKAGYERAVSVYNSYLEDASNIDENEYECRQFLSDGRPNPRHMMTYAWPDNLNQIILDEDFELDRTIFPEYLGYTKLGYTMDFIDEYISYPEIVQSIENGARIFIKDKYPDYDN